MYFQILKNDFHKTRNIKTQKYEKEDQDVKYEISKLRKEEKKKIVTLKINFKLKHD